MLLERTKRVFLCLVIFFVFSTVRALAGELYLVIDKNLYTLKVMERKKLLWKAEIGYGLKSPIYKSQRGDLLTPEGLYRITEIRPSSRYYYFIKLSYPNFNDLSLAYFKGRIDHRTLKEYTENQKTPSTLGSDIGIHGGGAYKKEKGIKNFHWTQGCISLNNQDLDRLLQYVKPGQKVYILDSSKPLFEILKKFAFPKRVKPLEFWEADLYLKINNFTFWYFKLIETAKGSRYLLWEEWIKGHLAQKVQSLPDGKFEESLELRLKEKFLEHINFILDPMERVDIEEWK